jgi:hypothetical protein
MVAPEMRDRINENFPSFAWLMDVPEIGALMEQAINEGWGPGRFQSALYATTWYRTRTESGRQMETLQQLDPAQFSKLMIDTYTSIEEWATKMGVNMTYGEMQWFTGAFRSQGVSVNDPAAQQQLINWIKSDLSRVNSRGAIYANANRGMEIARREYFHVPTEDFIMRYGIEAALGHQNEDTLRAGYQWMFGQQHPHLAARLEAGETLADIVNPWREMVAKELEFGGVDQVDMVQGSEWSWLLGVPDPGKPEVMRLPTAQEVTERVRRDTRWAYTMGGKNLATQATEAILKGFGVKA